MSQASVKKEAKTPFLQTHSIVKPYASSNLDAVFLDMLSEFGKAVEPKKFYNAASSIGTHAPKLAGSRNQTRGRILGHGMGNRRIHLAGSGNGADAPYMKMLLRPIAILGEEGEAGLFERVLSGGGQALLDAFARVFGTEARDEFLRGLEERKTGFSCAPAHENSPVFFLPGEDGGDLQASPAGSIEAHANMDRLKWDMRKQAKVERDAGGEGIYGDWSEMGISPHMQSVAVGGPKARTRFKTSFPRALNQIEADLWRYRETGEFPRMRDPEVAMALVEFAFAQRKFEGRNAYRGGDVKERQVDNRAKFIVMRARGFVEDFRDALEAFGVEKENLPDPDLIAILKRLPLRRALTAHKDARIEDEGLVYASLNSFDFALALKKYGK